MVSSFVAPVNTHPSKLGFENTEPVELLNGASLAEVELVIRAVYRQVLGNAHIMESERLLVPESQLKNGYLSVREFVRQVTKSELYRARFFDNCYRYRAIELNFKHLLGRAPDDYSEMISHSKILDEHGFDSDIDSYIDSDEYLDAFGECIVPYYRGYKTQTGKKMLGFTNMYQLARSSSSSDKDLVEGNKARLTKALISNTPYGKQKVTDTNALLAELFKPKQPPEVVNTVNTVSTQSLFFESEQALRDKVREQENQISALEKQLAELRPFASIGASQLNSSFSGSASSEIINYVSLQQQVEVQTRRIATLQEQVADARRYAAIGESKLNKWRGRTFSS
ncbi:MAG: phycobilisome rod-core linker polypeptide [Scytonematopsis contorta HA4267-MV1]|jgi:phycoerythrin-associated linker protein|nr:phycobilisome rod-core linker polypeptide [Scytonematopsis contorta HA4267-MV1]